MFPLKSNRVENFRDVPRKLKTEGIPKRIRDQPQTSAV